MSKRLIFLLALLALSVSFLILKIQGSRSNDLQIFHPPSTPQEYHVLARSLIVQGRYPESEAASRKALSMDPKFYKSYVDLGNLYILTGDYIKGINNNLEALKYVGNDLPNLGVIYYNLGCAYLAEGDAEKSWEYLHKVYAMNYGASGIPIPNKDSEPEYWMAASGDKEAFLMRVREDTRISEAISRKMNALLADLHAGRYSKVLKESQHYLDENPGSSHFPIFIRLMIEALWGMKLDSAAAQKLVLLENAPVDEQYRPMAAYLKAKIAYREKRYREALQYSGSCLAYRNPPEYIPYRETEFMVRNILGNSQVKLDLEDIESMFSIEEYKIWAKYLFAQRHSMEKDYNTSLKIINSVIGDPNKINEKDYHFIKLAASVYEQKGDLIQARKLLELYADKFPATLNGRLSRLEAAYLYMRSQEYDRSYAAILQSGLVLPGLMIFISVLAMAAGLFLGILLLLSHLFFPAKINRVIGDRSFLESHLYVFLLLLFLLFQLMAFLFLAVYSHMKVFFDGFNLDPILMSILFSDTVLVIYALFLLKRKYRLDNQSLGFYSRGYLYNIILPIILVVSSFVILTGAAYLYERFGIPIPETASSDIIKSVMTQKLSLGKVLPIVLIMGILGPIAEEIIFRVFLCNFFEKYSNAILAVILSSLLFSLIHGEVVLIPIFFILGVILAVIYRKTKTIVPSMVTHSIYNLVVIGLAYKLPT